MASPADTDLDAPEADLGPISQADADILQEMHERWDYGTEQWHDIRKEGAIDMRVVSGDPWDPADRATREEDGRPVLSFDEIGQYVNELVNDIRQHKRAIKVTAIGNGATDQSAELTANMLRQIEYRSNAQQAYTTMFENGVQRSYGFLRYKPRYTNRAKNEQELIIESIANPDMVTMDPDILKPDGSDMGWLFYREPMTRKEFTRRWGGKRIVDFTGDDVKSSNGWITSDKVWVGEYWTAEPDRDDQMQVVQRFTNGLQILSTVQWSKKLADGSWHGTHIPFVACLGKVMFVPSEAGVSKKIILSLPRLARGPAMYYCYIRTNQAEVVGMTPKVPVVGYVGQFRTAADDWAEVNRKPKPYIEVDPLTEATGASILPIPQPMQRNSDLQSLEMLAEGARRAIQAAMGTSPLPTSAQRRNDKSGVALKQIDDAAARGSFHFVDHYEDSLTRTGVIGADLLAVYYDTPREVTVRKPDGKPDSAKINQPGPIDPKTNLPSPRLTFAGDHDITLGTGPNVASEREAANQFADTMTQALPNLMPVIGPQKTAKLLSLSVKLKDLGPIGDEIAETIDPTPDATDPAQLAGKLAEAQGVIQQMQQKLQELGQAIQTDQVKAQAAEHTAVLKADADFKKAQLDAETTVTTKQMELASEERRTAMQVQAQLAIADSKVNADAAQALIDAQNERDIIIMKLDHEKELGAEQRAHEAGEKDKDRSLASATKKKKTMTTSRGADGALSADVTEESTVEA